MDRLKPKPSPRPRRSPSTHCVEAPEVIELVQLVLLFHIDVPPKQQHLPTDAGGGVEGAGCRAHCCLFWCKPRLLLALEHRQII
jgi:hypothetical protein